MGQKYVVGLTAWPYGSYIAETEEDYIKKLDAYFAVTAEKKHHIYRSRKERLVELVRYDTLEEAQAAIDEIHAKNDLAKEMGYGTGRYQGD